MLRPLTLPLLLIAGSASAEGAEVKLGGGLGFAPLDPNVRNVPYVHVSGVVDIPLHPIMLSVRLRAMAVPRVQNGYAGEALAGVRVPLGSRAFARLLAGVGISGACIRGDYCGAAGLAGALEIGGRFPITEGLFFVVNGELSAQSGVANLPLGILLTPGFATGLAF